jgi:hypothetical protein
LKRNNPLSFKAGGAKESKAINKQRGCVKIDTSSFLAKMSTLF